LRRTPTRSIIAALLLVAFGPSPALAAKPFTLFETGLARPLALSPSGNRLFAVNAPDNRLEVFDVGVGALTHVVSVSVGLEPMAVAARSDTEVWVVNHLSDSVSIVDLSDPANAHVVRTLLVGDEPSDIVFGGSGFDRAFITAAHRGQNTPYQATIVSELTTPGLGRADVWVFDAGNLGTSLGGDPLTIVTLFGDTPRALAVTPDGGTVYAAVFLSGNRTTTVAEGLVPDGGEGAGGLPEPNVNFQSLPQPETGLIVQFDGAAWRDELGRDWSGAVKLALPDEDVFAIDADASPPVQVVGPGGAFAGVGTILFDMIVNPANDKLYVANTEAFNRVRFEGPGVFATGFKPMGEPTTVQGHLHESRITVIDGLTVAPRHLNKHIDYGTCCAPVPNAENDTSIAFPVGMAVSGDGQTLYVAGFGTSEIGVYDTTELENDTFTPDAADQIPVSGGGPTGIVLDEGRMQLYVLTRFDDAVKVLSTTTGAELVAAPLHNPEPPSIVQGRPFFYDASHVSSHGDSACASCHVFGDFDGLAWDLGNPDGATQPNPGPFEVGPFITPDFRPMKGPMVVLSLRGMANHGPMHWRGDRTGGNDVNPAGGTQPDRGTFDEDAGFKKFNVAFFDLVGRSGPLPADEMQKFTDFILQVTYPPNPIRNLDNSLTPAQQTGHDFFVGPVSDSARACVGCHVLDRAGNAQFGVARPGFFGTDGDYGFQPEPQIFKIPHLRNAYQKVGMFGMAAAPFFNPGDNGFTGDQTRGFGFMHDGSADTLFRFHRAAVFNQSGVNPNGIPPGAAGDVLRRNLEAFVLAFDSNLFPIVGQQITRTSTGGAVADARIDLLEARADAGECDLVVKGRFGGEDQGFLYTGAGQLRTDRAAEPSVADATLRALADTPGQELTYTCVPPGDGPRIAIDRDGDTFLDGDERDGGTDPADAFSVPDVCPGDPNCVKCRRVIAKESSKYARARAKHLARCEGFKIKGKLPLATDCATEVKTVSRIASARHVLATRIANACGGDDNVCNGDPSERLPAVLGWGPVCPNLEGGACGMPISDCGDVAACLACIDDAAVDQAIDLAVGTMSLVEPIVLDDLNTCQQKIAKESRKFLDKKSKAVQKCWDKRLKGNHTDTCPDPAAALGTVARKTADQVAKAESKLAVKLCKACGGADRQCDGPLTMTNGDVLLGSGGSDDLDAGTIGFPASCPDVTVPGGGPSCAGAVSTLTDLIECVACVSEFKVDCVDRAQVPEFAAYPGECNP
jgi:DNA-binding beta-propeller fold protein YncE